MLRAIIYTIIGYLSGSVLYAKIYSELFHCEDVADKSRDGNPGTSNAFIYGGFTVGVLTLICDLAKGIIPVCLYTRGMTPDELGMDFGLPFVLAAPVIGHILPIFFGFSGGKGIATTFGCLLGLAPYMLPALTLAFYFIFFSVIVRITAHFHRTIITYLFTAVSLYFIKVKLTVCLGFILIMSAVQIKFHHSCEERQKFEVKLLWMH